VAKRIIWLIVTLLSFASGASKDLSIAQQVATVVNTIKKYHYKPHPLDDSLSSLIFTLHLKAIDPFGCFFSKDQVQALERFRYQIDDQINKKKSTFVDTVSLIYSQQLLRADSLIDVVKKRGIDLTQKDSICIGGTVQYADNSLQLKKWEQLLRYMVDLSFESQLDSADTISKLTKEKAATLLNDVVEWEKCKVHKLIGSENIISFIHDQYLKTVANAFDPHTDFLTTDEQLQRRHDLSKTSGSFGIMVDQNIIGEIEIVEILPGSPAWICNKINEGDVILSIKRDDGVTLKLKCTSLSEIEEVLNGINHHQAIFKIRKKTGSIIEVPLKKALIDVKQNIVRSYILKEKSNVGYIYLPSFYTEFYSNNFYSQGCANDLARELLKLKNDSINGLILDLRGNGGGLVNEALRLAGLFIDFGGLSIFHEHGTKPSVQKDDARGSAYTGPLVVLVNSASASAAELLASTLQDYNRAIIAGSATFGKATMQTVIPYDAGNFDSLSRYKGNPEAFLSVTTGAIYRVTGNSNQSKGVMPDIVLPDILEKFVSRESAYASVINLDTIIKKVYYYPLASLPVEELQNRSKKRLHINPMFQLIRKKCVELPDPNKHYTIPLEVDSFLKFMNNFEELKDSLTIKKCSFSAKPPQYLSYVKSLIKSDQEEITRLENEIRSDIYINEAFMILHDWFDINKSR
jgi:carboxyl-terminal processing protease